ncbi:DUF4296 domain-containing protein [Tenacibaculum piscium]|nr:DUF4296 domain-containing protein [Tenacibaculum piscium]MBE7669987.1 DUF4296 domain-containing protein [Tenacibaculum piscium]MBE7685588.1 DUF4296 domain-containing protein [Tenacibaculum piscium]MBE7690172.1 DUF4296 domain-containing protein [Tenacibaculum piscium]MCG8183352.1 DUF4296 domain-containing protein [Tenacibaculum piscium]MCG8204464.1 DUF4296 domain-containing protein [Tenacibaculum piscium]
MKYFFYLFILMLLACCTSNTKYEKPKNLIPKDSMIALLTDMYIVASTKNIKNKLLKRDENYTFLIYEKYKIDTTRFNLSNVYYTSKVEEYGDMLKEVKKNIDSLERIYMDKSKIQDTVSNNSSKNNIKNKLQKNKLEK